MSASHPRTRRTLALAALALLAALAAASSARAGEYAVAVCQENPAAWGASYANGALGGSVNGPGSVRDACASGWGLETGVLGGSTPGQGAALVACAPPGTRFVAYRLDLQRHWQGSGYNNPIDTAFCGRNERLDGGGLPATFDTLEGWQAVGRSFNDTGLRLLMECRAPLCTGNWAYARYKNIRITVRDDAGGPALADPGGLWTATGWVRGVQPARFAAEDNVGVRRMRIEVDPGGSNGTGWPHDQARACDYSRLVPCERGRVATSYNFDTARVADGAHTLRYAAEDSGRTWTSAERTILVDNQAPSASLASRADDYGRVVRWQVADADSGVKGDSLRAAYSTDGGATWQTLSGSWVAADGIYTATLPAAVSGSDVRVRLSGSDNAAPGGNAFTSPATIAADATAPTAPAELSAKPAGWSASNSFDVSWTNPSGQVAPIAKAHWRLCPVGAPAGCVTGSTAAREIATLAGLSVPAPGAWDLTIWLEDAAGNTDPAAAAGPAVLRFDPAPPGAAAISTPGRWLNASDPTYWDAALTTARTDSPSGVEGYSVTRDGSDPDASVDRAGATATWRVADLPDGTTTLRARGVSGAGVSAPATEEVIRMDRERPTAALRGAGDPATPHPGPITVTLNGRDAVSGMSEAPDDEAVTSGAYVAYRLDGGDWVRVRGDEAQIPVTSGGTHRLAYFAVDAAGNPSGEGSRTIAIAPGEAVERPRAGFADRSYNPGTTFAAARRFGEPCPGQATLAANRDATLSAVEPNARGGGAATLVVGARREALAGFPLPPAPDCVVERAVLRLHAPAAVDAKRTIAVKRAGAAWDEGAVTWNTRPGTVGSGSVPTTSNGWTEWDVTAQVQALYSYGDNGLSLRDAADTPIEFCSREAAAEGCSAAERPQLVLGFGE